MSFDLFFEVDTTDPREVVADVLDKRMVRELEIYATGKWSVTTEDIFVGDLGSRRLVRLVVSARSLEDACHDITGHLRCLLDYRYPVRLVLAMARAVDATDQVEA